VNVKALDIASKGIRENLRDRRSVIFLVGLPALLIILFSFSFGSGSFQSGGLVPHEIVVINNDAGVRLAANNTTQYVNYGASFTGVLENATSTNTTTHLFNLNNVSEAKAEDLLKSRSIDALVIIPQNFSGAFVTMVNNSTRTVITSSVGLQAIAPAGNRSPGGVATVPGANVILPEAGNVTSALQIQGDTGYVNFVETDTVLTSIFDQYKNGVQANATARAEPGADSIFKDFIPAKTIAIPGTQSFSMFDYLVPGLIVFCLLLQVSLVASSLVRDIEKGTLDRIKLSKAGAFDLLFGTLLTWTLITIGQVIILIGVAIVLGYKHQGDFSALGLATLIGVIAGMASISLALLIASFAKNDMQAMLLGAMIAVPLGFMAGAFLPLPKQVLGEIAGRTYVLWEALPWTWAVSSMRSVLTYGSGLNADVAFDTAWLIFLTAMLFITGVAIYSRARLRAEK
jgi:ABC-2 type transport system permease protein